MATVGIIGAGATGLSAAYDLSRNGHTVTVFEAGSELGGLAAGFRDESWEWTLEKFYHHWFESDSAILGLIRELGYGDKIMFPRPKTSFWIDGNMYRSEISPSALFLPLSPLSKIRFGAIGAYIKLTPFWKSLEKYTADEWLTYFMGAEAYGKFFKPLLLGKFGDLYNQVNMAWMWARVTSRTLRLGTFEGGFQHFLDLLGDKVRAQGATIYLNTPVQRLHIDQNMKPTLTVNGIPHTFDWVISTASPNIMLKLSDGLADTGYGDQMKSLESIGGLCVVLATKQSLMTDGTYWLNLPASTPDKTKNPFPFLALVEHTNYMDKAHYGGDHILYLGDYAPTDHEYFKLSDEALIARLLPSLKQVNPNFNESWIRKAWVWKAPYAQPIPRVNHSERIPALQTPLPNVIWASMSQVYPHDRGTNYAVEMGRKVAGMIK
jgi:protoporphyrinogen oxidase